jgi:hypothetical protein
MVDAHSGAAGIAYWLNTHMGVEIDKRSRWCIDQGAHRQLYEACRTTVMSHDELEPLRSTNSHGAE